MSVPAEFLQKIHHVIGDFINDKAPAIADWDEPYALSLFDDLLDLLLKGVKEVNESGIGDTLKAGIE